MLNRVLRWRNQARVPAQTRRTRDTVAFVSRDIDALRSDFPALDQQIGEHPLVYLDSAATALKPQCVIDAVVQVYARDAGNVHRGVHALSARATASLESARAAIGRFIGASADEIVFVRGTTEALNLIAHGWARPRLSRGDEIVITELEHHANIVPWQVVCQQTGARLVVSPIADDGSIDLAAFQTRLSSRTRVVSLAHVSNALGTLVPVEKLTRLVRVHAQRAVVVIDGAQAVPHLSVDVTALDCDFYAFSGHKLYGPTGVGVLWGKPERLAAMSPYQTGGAMIESVTFEHTEYAAPPRRFEAGTPHIAGVVGLGAAVEYMNTLDLAAVRTREAELLRVAHTAIGEIPGVRIIGGHAPDRLGVLAFTMDCAHPHDIGTICDAEGVAIRTGHHCAQPTMARYGVTATARISIGLYNRRDDIDRACAAIDRVRAIFG